MTVRARTHHVDQPMPLPASGDHVHKAQDKARDAGSVWPGLFLTAAVAGAAFALWQVPVVATLSPMILAILIGIAFHNLIGTTARAKSGVVFSLRRILRLAIILLGLQLTATWWNSAPPALRSLQ